MRLTCRLRRYRNSRRTSRTAGGGPLDDEVLSTKLVYVSTLKARLSEFLRLVKSGETILVTERGRPVALLSPVA